MKQIPAGKATDEGVKMPENRCPITIVGIGGSLRRGSASLAALLGPPLVVAIAGALNLRSAFGAVAAVGMLLALLTRYAPRSSRSGAF